MAFVLQDIFGRQYPLGTLIKIGNDKTNNIILLDAQVSKHHANIREQEGNVLLQDLNSTSGTFVNQARIEGTVPVKAGDSISIGVAVFKVAGSPSGMPVSQPMVPAIPPLPPPPPALPPAPPAPKGKHGCRIAVIVGIFAAVLLLCLALFGGWYFISITNPAIIDSINEKLNSSSPQDTSSSKGSNNGGPAVMNIEEPAFMNVHTTSFIFHSEDIVEGMDTDGNELVIKTTQDGMEQSTPEWSSYNHYVVTKNDAIDQDNESAFLNGKVYTKSGTKCSVSTDTSPETNKPNNWSNTYLSNAVKGQAKKVESGVTIKGILTDKYRLTESNAHPSEKRLEFVSGELYRARNGGYLVSFKIVEMWPAGYRVAYANVLSSDKPIKTTTSFEISYYPEGKLKVIVPAVCASEVNK